MEVPRERKRVRDPTRGLIELGPGGLDHGLKLRASARSRFGDFRAIEAEVLPAGSAQLSIVSLSGSATTRACWPASERLTITADADAPDDTQPSASAPNSHSAQEQACRLHIRMRATL